MSIASRIEAIEQHLTDDYSVLEVAGANLTNVDKNIINLKPTWQERLLYFINNGTDVVWNNWEKVEGTGETLTLNSTEEAPMKINLKGNTSQEGTPTPETPQAIHVVSGDNEIQVCGKNLFDKNSITLGYIDSNGNVVSAGVTNVSTSDFILIPSGATNLVRTTLKNSAFYDEDKVFISRIYSTSLPVPNNAKYIRLTVINTDLNNEQLEVGSTATTYEPYQSASYPISLGDIELCKIGTYQDSIKKSTGKNLFDKDNANVLDGMFINASAGNIGSNANATSIYIPINPNTTYCVSKTRGNRFAIGYSSTTPAVNVSLTNIVDDRTKTSLTSTSASDSKYLVIYISLSDTETYENIISTIQIEYGNTPTDFEPYGKVWYLNKQIGKVVLDGSEEGWNVRQGSNPNLYVYYLLNNYVQNSVKESGVNKSNRFIEDNTSGLIQVDGGFRIAEYNLINRIFLCVNSNIANTINNFKTWLSSNNTIVYYALATPTTTEITDTTLISQLDTIKRSYDEQTNITQVNNDLPFILDVTALKQLN